MPQFFEMSPLSGAEKHRDFKVTSCHQNVTTNVDFGYIELAGLLDIDTFLADFFP